ncbi:MFS transporter [Acidipropionibacterium timonense]|uniref:MFS transporter n=1 Tax=Acidipropionibacterium timonense TaxID=2161818 RepID=UPI0010322456|nr:MFS transporter [Acidipropionibacterium timonense]
MAGRLLKRARPSSLVAAGMAGAGVALVAICALVPNVLAVAMCIGIGGIAMTVLDIASGYAIQRLTPENVIGRVQAASNAMTLVPGAVAVTAGSLAIAFVSFRVLYLASAAACALACVVLLMERRAGGTSAPAPEGPLIGAPHP